MNLLSLYSGIGGIDLAAHWAGMSTVAFCEADAFCRSVLARHWPDVPIFESDEHVTRESIHERIDIIAGGPPCQPFSVAGKREGATDARHRWPQMARIVDELRPAYVVVENVAGFSDVAERLVRADLDGIGYRTVRFDIPAAGVGAPHKRERIFVVGYAASARRERAEDGGTDRRDARENGRGRDESLRTGERVADDDRNAAREPLGVTERVDSTATVASGSGVADSDSTGRRERRRAESVRPELDPAECGSSGAVADAAQRGIRRGPASRPGGQPSLADEADERREAQSRLGRDAYGLTDRLDAANWPAAYGSEQHDYEPPRVTTEREFRRKRLKALGNAVVPLQIYPILAMIAAIHQETKQS